MGGGVGEAAGEGGEEVVVVGGLGLGGGLVDGRVELVGELSWEHLELLGRRRHENGVVRGVGGEELGRQPELGLVRRPVSQERERERK